MNWHLNKLQYPVYNLGPGKRIGIWVQGCSIHCKGCINKSTWSNKSGKKIPILEIYNLIDALCRDYDGITITGGEPFDQYPQLMAFALLIKKKTKLNVLCYTGYYLDELDQKFPDKAFYSGIDFLIDGRYEKDLISINSMKGSENQCIYEFIDKRAIKTNINNIRKTWSISCEQDTIYMAGIPQKNEIAELTENMKLKGIHLELV